MLASISSLTRKRGLRARGLPSQWRRSACRALRQRRDVGLEEELGPAGGAE